jgi:hypothetical protein
MDDSADQKRIKIFVVAGLLGHSEDWFETERHWKMRLAKSGIAYFRTSNFSSLSDGGFRELVLKHGGETARKIANELFEDLKLILKSSNLAVSALGVLMKDYKKVLAEPDGSRVLQSDPFVHAHQQIICKMASIALETIDQRCIAFLYDQTNKAAAMQGAWDVFKERNPLTAQCMGVLSPLDDKVFPCIQMADIIANATKRMFEKKIDSGTPLRRISDRVELEAMSEWANRLGWIGFWDETYLRIMVKANLKHAAVAGLTKRKNKGSGKRST